MLVLFKVAEALKQAGYDASILIPGDVYAEENPSTFRPEWFDSTIPITCKLSDITQNDVVFIHEESIWAYKLLKQNNPRHIMINQGAQSTMCIEQVSYREVNDLYRTALGVLVVSDYISETMQVIFDIPSEKIHVMNNMNLISGIFNPGKKRNKILIVQKYTSEKNAGNKMIIKMIKERYDWEVEYVDHYTQQEVARAMAESKILVFLCNDSGEGFGLPPVEAAISGCKVIGYSGLGGRPFWEFPTFTEIEFNDVNKFVQELDYWTLALKDTTIMDLYPRAQYIQSKLSNARNIQQFNNETVDAVKRILNG